MKNKSRFPTESELQILHILWEEGPCSVRKVNELLNNKREVGYTTTLKLMQIMLEKGLAIRNTDQRQHIYSAAISEDTTQHKLLQQFLSSAFRGSAKKLVMQALGNADTTKEELEEIKALIAQLENNR